MRKEHPLISSEEWEGLSGQVIGETILQTSSFAVVQIKLLRGRPRNKVGLRRKFVLRVQDSEKLYFTWELYCQ